MKTVLFIILLSFASLASVSQSLYKQENQTFVLSGTSNINDWKMTSNEATGTAIIDVKNNTLYSIEYLQISIPAESLNSNRPGMDMIAQKAMNTDKYPTILYTLNNIVSITPIGNKIEVVAIGQLNFNGVIRNLQMTVMGEIKNNQIVFEGRASVRMTDYNIDPPVALFGTIKTADETVVYFNIKFTKKQEFTQQSEK